MSIGRFQVAAGAVIRLKSTDQILLIYRVPESPSGDMWEIPVGRLNQLESFEDGLKREVREETGISDLNILGLINVFSFMRGKQSAENEVKGVVFAAETSQKKIILSPEHNDYKWVSVEEAIKLVEHSGVKADLVIFRDTVLSNS